MSQAIVTKFLPPTNVRGSRVKAVCDAGSVTISYDYALNGEDSHAQAAVTLVRKLGWDTVYNGQPARLIRGGAPLSWPYSYVFVFQPVEPNVDRDLIDVTDAKWAVAS